MKDFRPVFRKTLKTVVSLLAIYALSMWIILAAEFNLGFHNAFLDLAVLILIPEIGQAYLLIRLYRMWNNNE